MRASASHSTFSGHCGEEKKSAPTHEIFNKPFFYHRTRPRISPRIRQFDFTLVADARFERLTSYTKPPQIDNLTNDKKLNRCKLGVNCISAPRDVEEVRSPRAEGSSIGETHPWISELGRRWKLKPPHTTTSNYTAAAGCIVIIDHPV